MACSGVTPLPLIGCCFDRPATCTYLDGTPLKIYILETGEEESSLTQNFFTPSPACAIQPPSYWSSRVTHYPFFGHMFTQTVNFNKWTKLGTFTVIRDDGQVDVDNGGNGLVNGRGQNTSIDPLTDPACFEHLDDTLSGPLGPGEYFGAADELIDWLDFDFQFPETTIPDWRTVTLSPVTVGAAKDAAGGNVIGYNPRFGVIPQTLDVLPVGATCAFAMRLNGLVPWSPGNNNAGFQFLRRKLRILTESPYWLVHLSAPTVASVDGVEVYPGGAYDTPICEEHTVDTPFGGRAWIDIPSPAGGWNYTLYYPYRPSFC